MDWTRYRQRVALYGAVTRLLFAVSIAQAGCQAAAPPQPPPEVSAHVAPQADSRGTAAPRTAPGYDLARDERHGGHTLSRHVGRSDEDLRERLRREPQISAASTYTDRATAERVVAEALAHDQTRIEGWLERQGPRPNLTIDYRGPGRQPIGRSLMRRSGRIVACSDALIVLRWDGRDSFYVLTTYPEASR